MGRVWSGPCGGAFRVSPGGNGGDVISAAKLGANEGALEPQILSAPSVHVQTQFRISLRFLTLGGAGPVAEAAVSHLNDGRERDVVV
jgi:hypothetical protein